METTSKFFLKSLTVWGIIIGALCGLIHSLTGVNLEPYAGPLGAAITALVNALPAIAAPIGQLTGVIMAIVGRFRATQPLHILAPKQLPSGLSAVAFAAILGLGFAELTGCATTTPGPTPTPSPVSNAIESALPLVRTGAAVATGAVLDFAVNQSSTRTRLANEMYAAANAVYSLSGGTFPTPTQFQSSILAFGGSQADANYAQFSTAIAGLYAAYFPKLQSGDTKTATDLLNAIAGGIEDATASYVTTPAAPPTPALEVINPTTVSL